MVPSALRLTLKPDPTCSDLWTDGRTVGFNPSYAAALSEAALIGAHAHEVMHLACAHHVRREERDTALWNKACDIVVNQAFAGCRDSPSLRVPCMIRRMPGFPVEALYSELARLQDEAPNKGAKRPEAQEETEQTEGGSGQPGEGKGQGKGQNDPTEGERGEAELLGGHGASESSLDKGKGQRAKPWPLPGEVRDHPVLDGGSGTAQKQAEQEADIELVQAMQRAKHMGDMPAGLLPFVPKAVAPNAGLPGHPSTFPRKLCGRRLHMDHSKPPLSLPGHLPPFAAGAPYPPYCARRGQLRFRGQRPS